MNKTTCYYCTNGKLVSEDIVIDCDLQRRNYIKCNFHDEIAEIGKEHEWNARIMPTVCGKFAPKMVEACRVCKKAINVPEHEWDKWGGIKSTPVCSDECRREIEAQELADLFAD